MSQPVINRVEPSSGAVGTMVTIYGQNFGNGGTVAFNGVVAVDSLKQAAERAQNEADQKAGEAKAAADKAVTAKNTKGDEKPSPADQKARDEKNAATLKEVKNAGPGGPITHSDPVAEAEMHAQVESTADDKEPWKQETISACVPEGATTGDIIVTVDGVMSNGSQFKVIPAL